MYYRTPRTELRPPGPDDLPYLHYLLSHPQVGPHVRFRGTAIDPSTMTSHLYQGMLGMQMVISRQRKIPLGLLMLHDGSELDGYAQLSAVAEPATVGSGVVLEAAIAFLRHAFDTWPLRKVYINATESTLNKYKSVTRRFAHLEGVLRSHAYADGRFQDVTVLAIYRDEFVAYCADRFGSLLEPVRS